MGLKSMFKRKKSAKDKEPRKDITKESTKVQPEAQPGARPGALKQPKVYSTASHRANAVQQQPTRDSTPDSWQSHQVMIHNPNSRLDSTSHLCQLYISGNNDCLYTRENNSLNNQLARFLRFSGANSAALEVEFLRRQLIYRLMAMQRADLYVQWLGLDSVPPIGYWNPGSVGHLVSQFWDFVSVVWQEGIFLRPCEQKNLEQEKDPSWGEVYLKPVRYLAFALMSAGIPVEHLPAVLNQLPRENKEEEGKCVSLSW